MSGSAENAKETFQRRVELVPGSAQSHYLLSGAYASQQDIRGTVKALESALKLQPDYLPARLAYTRALLATGNLEGAAESLEILKSSAGDNIEVKYLEGLIASRKGNSEKALSLLQEVFDRAPTTDTLVSLVQQQWETGQKDAVFELFERWVTKYPKDTKARVVLAESYLADDRIEDAIAQIARCP